MVFSDRLNKDILEATPDPTLVVNVDGVIVFANRLVEGLLGYAPGEIIDQDLEMLLPDRYRVAHRQYRNHYGKTAAPRKMGDGRKLFAMHRDGHEIPVEISLSPVSGDDGDVLIISSIRDISDRYKIESELTAAMELAKKADLTKSRFLATASHDLRQPVQTLKLLNRSLTRLVEGSATQSERSNGTTDMNLGSVIAQQENVLDSMAELLNALLDISKLESGAVVPDISNVDVSRIFERMRDRFQRQAEEKGLELVIDECHQTVRTDPTLLEQMIQNLVGNAIRYTQAGKVMLRACLQNSHVHITVNDTGVGIPRNQLASIFDEFHQVSGASGAQAVRQKEGFGLGLAIVERVAKLLNHPVKVESEEGRGSKFLVEVPAASVHHAGADRSPEQETAEKQPPQKETTALKVLLIDDDCAVLDATSLFLRIEGYEVFAYATIAEAVEVAAKINPDIVVSDYHLSGLETGAKAIQHLRARLAREIPAVIMSGDTSSMVQDWVLTKCVVMSKPVNPDKMAEVLRSLLEDEA